jgi:hypothetical protein
VAGAKRAWLTTLLAYTLAGGLASASVGIVLGVLGQLVPWPRGSMSGALLVVAVGLLAGARELGWIALPLPQPRRQTKEVWGKTLRRPIAATLWGLDLGSIFTTWFTFAGTWMLIALAFVSGDPIFGATLLSAYWLGRALSVWVFPFVMSDANDTPRLLDDINAEYRTLQRVHVMAFVWFIAVLVGPLNFDFAMN